MSPRVGLDRAAVVRAAGDLADRDGYAALSLARLAEAVGVRTPSLFNHIEGLDDLRRAVAVAALVQLTAAVAEAAVGASGDAAVLAAARAYRAFARAHPGRYAAFAGLAPPFDAETEEVSAALVGVVARVLAGYGLSGDDAVHAVRGLRSLLHGFVTIELAGGFGLPLDIDESFERMVRAFAAGLSSGGRRARGVSRG